MSRRLLGLSFTFFLLSSGCATYQARVEKARQLLQNHENEEALGLLKPLATKESDDQLVYLFDYATALQAAGKYKESNESFAKADELSDIKNYLSISRFAGSLLLNEEMTQYRGEDYERLLINVMASLNYVMLGDRESALVEIRRLYEKLEYYRVEQKKPYEQNTAAIYLSALLWEADRNWDSAYIDFERAYKRDPSIHYIREDLIRAAVRADRQDAVEKWSKTFSIRPKPEWKDKDLGEVVFIFQQGWGPRKAERPRVAVVGAGFVSPGLPMLQPVSSSTRSARVELVALDNVDIPTKRNPQSVNPVLYTEETRRIYSVQDTAIKTLEDAYAPLIAKRIAAYAAKYAVTNQVKDEGLGMLLNIAMQVTDRADLRQWSTLPETIQVAKFYARPGKYRLAVRGLLSDGTRYSAEDMAPVDIVVKPREKTFYVWRSFR